MSAGKFATQINSLRAALMLKGLTLSEWARKNGYKPVTVQAVVSKYWGDPKPPICGMLTHEILEKLKKEVEPEEVREASNG